jgi:hypothetical protein
MRKFAIVVVILIGAVLVLTAQSPNVRAADDIQQIKLGPHVFYVPEAWMQHARDAFLGQGRVLALAPPNIAVDKAHPGSIDATHIGIWPGVYWQPYGARDLPKAIEIISSSGRSPPDEQAKLWLDQAASQEPDSDGFVRVETGFANPGEAPQWETFLYKGYLNKVGEPLVIHSNNMETPHGGRYLSDVTIRTQPDLILAYHFDNEQFRKNTWWGLYQRVIAFIDYLQTPK